MNTFLPRLSLRFLSVILLVFGLKGLAVGQKEETLLEVTIKGIRPERFMVGQKVLSIDSATMARFRFSQVNDFLQYQLPVVFRTNGVGQVSSISMRGTSAMHTAVLWNGVNINSPTVGQTDFASMPLVAFDQMAVQYGSSASVVGSDAVGGSLILRSLPNLNLNKTQFLLATRLENSNSFNGQFGLQFNRKLIKNWTFAGKTVLYGQNFRSNLSSAHETLSFKNNLTTEFIRNLQRGFIQDLYLLNNKGKSLSVNVWLSENLNSVSPGNVQNPTLTEIAPEQLNSTASRFVVAYQAGKTLYRTAFIRDFTAFTPAGGVIPSDTRVDRYIGRVEHDLSWIKSPNRAINLKLGTEIVFYDALVDGYGSAPKTEIRNDFYALLRLQTSEKLSASLNLRQAMVQGYNPPFTPSLGLEYQLIKSNTWQLSALANSGFSYRVPTLNERFWDVLGNPDLKPEIGFNNEIGLSAKLISGDQTIETNLTTFRNLIDNWTYWNPEKRYRVENLQSVLSRGIEVDFKHQIKFENKLLSNRFGYSLNNISQYKEYGPYTATIVGKQLIYVPKHSVNLSSDIQKNQWQVIIQQQFNSRRFITFDHSGVSLEPYYLLNLNLNYQYKKINIALTGNNLTNTPYASIRRTLMPLRTFGVNVVANL